LAAVPIEPSPFPTPLTQGEATLPMHANPSIHAIATS
jgi:hypothetical protein